MYIEKGMYVQYRLQNVLFVNPFHSKEENETSILYNSDMMYLFNNNYYLHNNYTNEYKNKHLLSELIVWTCMHYLGRYIIFKS